MLAYYYQNLPIPIAIIGKILSRLILSARCCTHGFCVRSSLTSIVIPYVCSQCSHVLFCSEHCQQCALTSYHRYECQYIHILKTLGIGFLGKYR
jgi:hypothetical protein